MNIFLVLIIFLTANTKITAVRDFSGLYEFQDCSCTVLRCLQPYLYQMNQTQTGDFEINYMSIILAARGKIIASDNERQTQITMAWLPGMDFDTNCTGLWISKKRSFDLKCGDQFRYCTGQFKCRDNSGPCAKNSVTALDIQQSNVLWKISFSVLCLLIIKISS